MLFLCSLYQKVIFFLFNIFLYYMGRAIAGQISVSVVLHLKECRDGSIGREYKKQDSAQLLMLDALEIS